MLGHPIARNVGGMKLFSIRVLAASAFFLIMSGSLVHAEPWVKTGGPIGGLGYDIRINFNQKNIMLVTDNWSGVNKSADSGATWSGSNSGIDIRSGSSADSIPIFSLTIDPNNPDIVWAGTQGEGSTFGVYKSADAGITWTKMINGISLGGEIGLVFRGFTIQSGNSGVVYAMAEVPTAVNGKEFNRTKGRIYKTADGGANWIKLWEGNNLARYLVIHPTDTNTLYASTGIFDREASNSDCANSVPGGVGVLKSSDGGTTWSQVNNGLTDLYVGSLRMHPANSSILFAATGNNACSSSGGGNFVSGLFMTVNGGATWTKVISNDIMTTVNFSPSNPDIVYAGSASAFYRSSDGGNIWTTLQKSAGSWGPDGIRAGVPIDVIVSGDDPNTLYVNNYGGGLFKSTDGANTWIPWSKGYTGADLHSVDIDPNTSGLIYVIGRSGPFKSADGGDNWTGIATGDAAGIPEWYSIRQKPDDTAVILMADEHQGVIFKSTNGGSSFTEVLRHPSANASSSTTRQGFKALAFSHADTKTVYAGLAKDRNTIDSSTPVGTVIYKSTDAGSAWVAMPSVLDGKNVNVIIPGKIAAGTAYAGTTSGLFKSMDGAVSWAQLSNLGNVDIRALAVDPSSSNTIYAAQEKVGIWKTIDDGVTWAGPKNTGFSSGNPSIRGIAIDPTNTGTIYAGDWTSGVYKSTDSGETWSPFPDSAMQGLSTRAIKSLGISSDGTVLYAATQGEGVFRFGTPVAAVTVTPPTTTPAGGGGGGCFIATAVYGSYFDWHVQILRDFRDSHLLTNSLGGKLVAMYYHYSPPIAEMIKDSESAKIVVRLALTPIVFGILYPHVFAAFIIFFLAGLWLIMARRFILPARK